MGSYCVQRCHVVILTFFSLSLFHRLRVVIFSGNHDHEAIDSWHLLRSTRPTVSDSFESSIRVLEVIGHFGTTTNSVPRQIGP